MKKHSKHSKETKELLSKSLKKYFETNTIWNKGKRFVEVRRDATFLRKDKDYYLKELKANAIRGKKNYYHNDPDRKEAIREKYYEYQEMTGTPPPREWGEGEIEYLEEHYKTKKSYDIALHLGRSMNSVRRKATRLGLVKYNKWN